MGKRNLRVCLIFPPKENFALREIKLHKSIDMEAGIYPPLGLLYIASYLLKYSNYEVKIIDSVAENLSYKDLETKVKKEKPDIVGIYTTTQYLWDTVLTARMIKSLDKDIKIIVGGPHVQLFPYETIKLGEFDYLVYGEGEIVFKRLLDFIKEEKDPEILPEVLGKNNLDKKLVRSVVNDLNVLPYPNRRLLPYKKYKSILAKKNPITTMMSSRGCPYNCHFCNSIERGKKPRYVDPKKVVDEIEDILRLGIEDILFFDENFASNRKRVIDICNEIIKRGIKVRWHCRMRADLVDRELVRKMKLAGCRLIQFGIESGTEHIQKVLNKNLNLRKVRENIKIVKDAGIFTYADFMIGSPEETVEEMKKTIEFAKELGLDYAMFGVLNPLPETEIYRLSLIHI